MKPSIVNLLTSSFLFSLALANPLRSSSEINDIQSRSETLSDGPFLIAKRGANDWEALVDVAKNPASKDKEVDTSQYTIGALEGAVYSNPFPKTDLASKTFKKVLIHSVKQGKMPGCAYENQFSTDGETIVFKFNYKACDGADPRNFLSDLTAPSYLKLGPVAKEHKLKYLIQSLITTPATKTIFETIYKELAGKEAPDYSEEKTFKAGTAHFLKIMQDTTHGTTILHLLKDYNDMFGKLIIVDINVVQKTGAWSLKANVEKYKA
ncbi:hypothetical protein MMC09_003632 [Bachmanniomyces sp. S44760]|nr:hypothetical protein [Bachmanniomyces sp. S44760]